MLVEPETNINLHNRGLGFNLSKGHPAEFGPGDGPPHTLSPVLATWHGDLVAAFGTMGGDAQPQILLQIAARLFKHGHSPAQAIHAARWALRGPDTGFDTWTSSQGPSLVLEGHARGNVGRPGRPRHWVSRGEAYDSGFGHAHAIVVEPNGVLAGQPIRGPTWVRVQRSDRPACRVRQPDDQLTSGMTSVMNRSIGSSAFL